MTMAVERMAREGENDDMPRARGNKVAAVYVY